MFHIELRQTSHRLHRFNLTEAKLRATVLEPWVRGEQVELGERIWSAHAGTILVLEGPEIPIGRLTMGRGWSVAQREGKDVTERALGEAREALSVAATSAQIAAAGRGVAVASGATGAGALAPGAIASVTAVSGATAPRGIAPGDAEVLVDALGLELLRGLGETPMSLVSAWRVACQRHPHLPLGVALEFAQRAVASLAGARLVAVSSAGGAGRAAGGGDLQGAELDAALAQIDSWTTESGADTLWLRRA